MRRVTRNELDLLVAMIEEEIGTKLTLHRFGRTWSLYKSKGHALGAPMLPNDGYLGETKREAGRTLQAFYAGILHGIKYEQDRRGDLTRWGPVEL